MAKKKIDLSRVKDFMFNHGEKVALGVCGFIAIVLGGLKLLDAADAGTADGTDKTWVQALTDAKNKISSDIASIQPKKIDTSSMEPKFYVWDDPRVQVCAVPLFAGSRIPTTRSARNPTALRILEDPKSFRLDYIRSLVFVHDYDKLNRTVMGIRPAGTEVEPPPPPPGPKVKGARGATVVPVDDRLKKGQAQSFVVVHAIFPMKQQVEEFRKALRLATQKELFDAPRDDLPQIKGINVVRFELTRIGGEPVPGKEPETIVQYFPAANNKGVLKLQPALEKLLRMAMYDNTTPPVLEPYLYDGLAMPLPVLAYGRYPKFQFPGWDLAWAEDPKTPVAVAGVQQPMPQPKVMLPGLGKGPKGGKVPNPNPMPAPGAGVALTTKPILDKDLRVVEPILSARLFGDVKNVDKRIDKDFNVFHVLGEFAPPADEVKPAVGPAIGKKPIGRPPACRTRIRIRIREATSVPGTSIRRKPRRDRAPLPCSPRGKPMPRTPPPAFPPWERDAVVRFIDADVQPGKTYSYAIQVRIANPNYKKDDKVAAAFLATVAELQDNASWVTTPSITIPEDYFVYAIDQYLFDEAANPSLKKETKLPKDATTFQIHQWVSEKLDQVKADRYVIGDWAIAERLVVRKGERIGAYEMWRCRSGATSRRPSRCPRRRPISRRKCKNKWGRGSSSRVKRMRPCWSISSAVEG